MNDVTLEIAGEELRLLAERALYWPRRATLFVADLHLGKAATMRAAGQPLPGGNQADLQRLAQALQRSAAARLVVLGDLWHARAGRTAATEAALRDWRAQHRQLDILLVRGNHDRRAGDPPADLAMRCVDGPYPLEPFVLRHEPEPAESGYVLAGHLHPAALLRGPGRQRLELACFWFAARVAVLPAFGSFTGTARIAAAAGDRVFVLADEVMEIAANAK